jgi:hypothetical protein
VDEIERREALGKGGEKNPKKVRKVGENGCKWRKVE